MGQAAEDLEYMEWCESMPRSEVNPRGYEVDPTWKTRDGKKIKLSKMTNSHIENCINLLNRKIATSPDQKDNLIHNIRIFQKELERRG